MPRLAPAVLRRAHNICPHLATLLPACRDLRSARNELRWIREHVLLSQKNHNHHQHHHQHDRHHHQSGSVTSSYAAAVLDHLATEVAVGRLCARRAVGEPLQYVLGSQPFGHLDLRCRRGVLIPRPETEAWVLALAQRLLLLRDDGRDRDHGSRHGHGHGHGHGSRRHDDATAASAGAAAAAPPLRVLDLCSGSGCIALLLYAQLQQLQQQQRRRRGGVGVSSDSDSDSGGGVPSSVRVVGLDVSPRAVRLARENRARNAGRRGMDGAGRDVRFATADLLADAEDDWLSPALRRHLLLLDEDEGEGEGVGGIGIDVLVANPPYVSARGFDRDTERCVRNHEPRSALVPPCPVLPQSPPPAQKQDQQEQQQQQQHQKARRRWLLPPDCAPEDIFYARLLEAATSSSLRLRPRVVALEVGDLRQGVRVLRMALSGAGAGVRWDVAEIWRDWPDATPEEGEAAVVDVDGRAVPVRGSGHGRLVFLRRG
ncbi:S-adenosyl-L-methionine-dependent methyltransferase [Xylariaceae sp. FL0804]|nr:S-adenosyl-L-methionine-dependent methyltransferase [Xylariaceae sp. FL0804]